MKTTGIILLTLSIVIVLYFALRLRYEYLHSKEMPEDYEDDTEFININKNKE